MITIYINDFTKHGSYYDLWLFLEILKIKKIRYVLKTDQTTLHVGPLKITKDQSEISHSDYEQVVKKEVQSRKEILFYEDEHCKIMLKNTKELQYYFILSTKKRGNETLYISRVKPFLAFLKKEGFSAYSVSQNLDDQSFSILPVRNTDNRVDINGKIINYIRWFIGDFALAHFDQLSDNLKNSASAYNSYNTEGSLKFPKSSTWLNLDKLEHNIRRSVFRLLEKFEVLNIENQNPFGNIIHPNVSSDTKLAFEGAEVGFATKQLEVKHAPCAFCNPMIIANQLILDLNGFLVLNNYKPYAGTTAHILIVPTHIEDWSHLTKEQIQSLTRIQNAVVASLQINCNLKKNQLISHVQNGVSAGQTISGSHLHIFDRPKWLPFLVDISAQMYGKTSPPLTKTMMSKIAQKLRSEIVQDLLSNASPIRFAMSQIDKLKSEFDLKNQSIVQNKKQTADEESNSRSHSDSEEQDDTWLNDLVEKCLQEMQTVSIVPMPIDNYLQNVQKQISGCASIYEARKECNSTAPSLIRALRNREYTLPQIQDTINRIDKIEHVLHYYVFADNLVPSKNLHSNNEIYDPFFPILTTPLHEAMIRGDEDILELLCAKFQKIQCINRDKIGQNQFEAAMDFYTNCVAIFGAEWSDEKRVRLFKLLEKYDARAKVPKITAKDFDALYQILYKKVDEILKQNPNKPAVFIVGESHTSKYSALIEILLLAIAQRHFKLKYHFLETSTKRLKEYRSGPFPKFCVPQVCVNFSDKSGLTVVEIDLSEDLREARQTSAIMNQRDYWMYQTIFNKKASGVATVGANHLKGIHGYHEKLRLTSNDLVFCFINAAVVSFSKTWNDSFDSVLQNISALQLPKMGVEHLSTSELEHEILAAHNRFVTPSQKSTAYIPGFDEKNKKETESINGKKVVATHNASAITTDKTISRNGSHF